MTPAERTFMGSHEKHVADYYEAKRLTRIKQDCRRAFERREGRVSR